MDKNKWIALLSPLTFFVFGIWVFITSSSMSRGNRTFPQIIAVLTIFISMIGLFSVLREKEVAPLFGENVNYVKLLTCVLSLCIYIFLMKKIGFYLDTLLLTSFHTWNMGYRKYPMLGFSSILITTVVSGVFYFLIKAPLPTLFM